MPRNVALALALGGLLSAGVAAPVPKVTTKSSGVFVLDNCDELYRGKANYEDNFTLFDSTGKLTFRVSGFNNCESIGCSRMVAPDPARRCVWALENVAHRLRRFDLAGKETLTIDSVHGSAIAVDPATGNVWLLAGGGRIGQGDTVVYNDKGSQVASHPVTGWDLAYDPRAKAFWIADRKLTKLTAATGAVVFTADITTWCASSLDVDPRTGEAWVAVREHSQVANSRNRLLKFAPGGKELVAVELGAKCPFRVSVDPKRGSVWVANFRQSVERFSADGKPEFERGVEAIAVQADPAGGDAWVVTPTEVQRMTSRGEVTRRAPHAGKTSQAWVAAVE
ncbi:MAG: hypothetical protein U0797_29295 [Gemmataceae bacterium]